MKIEILGCSGSVMPGYNTTSILINGDTLIDAGSAASKLSEDALSAIKNILLTHSHIDHIKELPFILDTMFSHMESGVTLWGSRDTIHALNLHIFNDVIWPEISRLNAHREFITFRETSNSEEFSLGRIRVNALRAEHIPGSFSYMITEGDTKVVFSGDTGFDIDSFDRILSDNQSLMAFFVEVSFPNRMEDFAKLTRHLTPHLLELALKRHNLNSTRIIAYHIKPKYLDEVVAELPANVAYISGGEVFEF